MNKQKYLYARVNSLLDSCASIDILISPLKLQKLLYFSYGIHLKLGGSKLDYLDFEAWTYGPVIPEVYHHYKHLKSNQIRDKMCYENNFPILLDDLSIDQTTKTITVVNKGV